MTQDPSDNEEEDDNVVFVQEGVETHTNGFLKPRHNAEESNGKTPTQEALEMGLLQKATVSKKKPTSDVEVKVMKRKLVTRTRLWGMAFVFLMVIALMLVSIFLLPFFPKNLEKVSHYKEGIEWVKEIEDYGKLLVPFSSCVLFIDGGSSCIFHLL